MAEWNVARGKLTMEYDCDSTVIHYMYAVVVKLPCLVVILSTDGQSNQSIDQPINQSVNQFIDFTITKYST